ncbi:gamma-glutamyltransferase 1 Threonine peptidase. MEROPS family T03 [Granulicella rosea]|uniref:Glutathione hydrolase proenzyme n=2 Tax=Granulicella rosea TaxID=474952 RepID=A0A239LCF3_9BACT|nr:gamma-glutamyltransferase 1 Threonine peptidase. MEROPS family T03 [Granulicella rosea]
MPVAQLVDSPAVRRLIASAAVLSLYASVSAQMTQPPPLPVVPPVKAKHAMVVSIQHDATDAGLEILQKGGNAVDAAVAVGFALAVVYPQAGNIGGGGFMLIRLNGEKGKAVETHFLDYRERAPQAATADMYLDKQGNVVPGLSTSGYKAIGVPGTVAGLVYAQSHYGKLSLAEDLAPAIRLAANGYELSEEEARALGSKNLTKFPESARVFQRGGDLYKEGQIFAQPDLAKTLTRIAVDPKDFYTGQIAQGIVKTVQKGGGLITMADLADYKVKDRAPLVGHYKGYEIITSPPPSSGGIVLLESLNILSGYDLPKLGADRSEAQTHLIVEAFRRAYMDRADYLGDPDYTDLPLKQMGDPAYAAAWRKGIDPVKPSPSDTLKRPEGFLPPPPVGFTRKEPMETTQYSVVDKQGNAVSTTYTLNGTFGCGATAEGLGFLLNNEMDDFASKPGTMNMFHLIQGPANAIAPGHRPLSSMTPTIVTKDGKLSLVLGSPGGSTIITTVANDLLSIVDNGLNVQQAADAPRFHHQYLPDEIQVEKRFDLKVVEELRAAGYKVSRSNEADEKSPGVWGDSELIMVDPKTGQLLAGHDQRKSFGKAAGY